MVDASSSCFDLACASDNLAVEKPTYTLKWFRARGWKRALLGGYERRTDRIWAIVFVKRHCDLSVQREGEIENPPFCSVKKRVSATRRHGMVWGKHVMGSHRLYDRKLTGSIRGPQADGLEPVRLDSIPRSEEVFYSAPNVDPAFRYFTPG